MLNSDVESNRQSTLVGPVDSIFYLWHDLRPGRQDEREETLHRCRRRWYGRTGGCSHVATYRRGRAGVRTSAPVCTRWCRNPDAAECNEGAARDRHRGPFTADCVRTDIAPESRMGYGRAHERAADVG